MIDIYFLRHRPDCDKCGEMSFMGIKLENGKVMNLCFDCAETFLKSRNDFKESEVTKFFKSIKDKRERSLKMIGDYIRKNNVAIVDKAPTRKDKVKAPTCVQEPKEIKAIETFYNGYRFRSRLEARYAVLFDEIGIKYEYECEGFSLSDGTRYLPDFYLPDIDVYFEVKGVMSDADREKISRFSSESNKEVVVGDPDFSLELVLKGKYSKASLILCERCHRFKFITDCEIPECSCSKKGKDKNYILKYDKESQYSKALKKAKCARFEHNDNPIPMSEKELLTQLDEIKNGICKNSEDKTQIARYESEIARLKNEINKLLEQQKGYEAEKKAEEEFKAMSAKAEKPIYLKLDITGYTDYLRIMTDNERQTVKGFSMTKYIRRLLKADMEAHIKEYETLKLS